MYIYYGMGRSSNIIFLNKIFNYLSLIFINLVWLEIMFYNYLLRNGFIR